MSAGALAVELTAAQLQSGPFNVVAATVDTSAVAANTRALSRRRQALEPRSRGSSAKRAAHVASTSNSEPIVLDLSEEAPSTTATSVTAAPVVVASALDVTASSISNLPEAADSELSRMRAARLARFA